MLASWLGEPSVVEFTATALKRTPLARPATTHAAAALFDWDVLDRVLASADARDVLVVARGHLLPVPPPRSLVMLRPLLEQGIGLCVRHGERVDPGLAAVATAFEADLGQAHVQLFITPANTHGFGWHFDDEDVFIAQTSGVKDYYFRANTATAAIASPDAFLHYPRETSALCNATLLAGDFLYIPARWWHMALCHEDALSISVGVWPRPA